MLDMWARASFGLGPPKLGWYPTKFEPDHGIDFVCQIRGDRIGKQSSEMTGKTLHVPVRSTNEDSDTVIIDRNDAELFFSTSGPMVFAIVKRAPIGQASQVAIKFVNEQFIRELDTFLRSSAKTHSVHFSEAITDTQEIKVKVEELFQRPYMPEIARLRAELRLGEIINEPRVEMIYTESGPIACVHSKDIASQPEILQRSELAEAIHDLPIKVVFTPFSLISPHNARPLNAQIGFSLSSSEGFGYIQLPERTVFIRQLSDVSRTMGQIQHELTLWNYDTAFAFAEIAEHDLISSGFANNPSVSELLFLLARVHVICAEKRTSETKAHIRQAKIFLSQIENISKTPDKGPLVADIEALRGSIKNLEEGTNAALRYLAKQKGPYAIRIRLAILLKKSKLEKALALIKNIPPDERWCELATQAYVLKDRIDKAENLVEWAATQQDPAKYVHCILHFADALLARALTRHKIGNEIHPDDLSADDRTNVRVVLDTLRPVLEPILTKGKIDRDWI